ncbi:glycosyltransferase family 4 protein [Flavobacterium oreochromis]|uniref:glycosyltransferase family 4 protein n=1 Tax=Flavobacterium oreochromis TaxID=2906078 RepID=UPI00385A179B
MKNIAILCNYQLLESRIGGMDYFFWRFQEAIVYDGWNVVWFFPNDAKFKEYSKFTIISLGNDSIEEVFIKYTDEKKIEWDYVVTHFIELCIPFFKSIKRLNTKVKIIAVDHNPRPLEGFLLKKKIKKIIKGYLYSKYIDVFVGVSHYTVKEIKYDFRFLKKSELKVVYNGIQTDKFSKRVNRKKSEPSFLVACHLRESKGIQDLIHAVYLLPITIKEKICIDIYGDGPYKLELLELCEKLKLKNNFNFKGSAANLYEIYALYDYLLQPTHMECFSLSILESLSANVPVITTPVGGNEEVIKHGSNGYIFPTKDYKKLAEIIEGLFFGKIGIIEDVSTKIENEFSIEKMVENHVKLLK